jgi:pyrroline-5-carboxylate reductase
MASNGPEALGKRIGFIGSGQMAEALARGLMSREIIKGEDISCSDPSDARKKLFQDLGCKPYESNIHVSC